MRNLYTFLSIVLIAIISHEICKAEYCVPACDSSMHPIIMVHGFLASGDTYETQALRFVENGYCPERLFMYDWNTLSGQSNVKDLMKFVKNICQDLQADSLYLIGHSAGAGLCFELIEQYGDSLPISKYVHLAGRPIQYSDSSKHKNVDGLNIYSDADYIVKGGEMKGFNNIKLPDADHYQVATSEESFHYIFNFFNGQYPNEKVDQKQTVGRRVSIEGKCLHLGTNTVKDGFQIAVYQVDQKTGFRLTLSPDTILLVKANGHWGPCRLISGAYYEFEVVNTADTTVQPIHYYRQPFYSDNKWVYFRTMPPANSPAGMLLSGLPKGSDDEAVIGLFAANQAIVYGRDSILLNDKIITNAENAKAESSNIAWFFYDANKNGKSDFTTIGTYAIVPFLTGIDIAFNTKIKKTYNLSVNGQSLNFRSWPAKSKGLTMLIFN